MTKAYFKGFGLDLGIEDPVSQRILAGGVVAIAAMIAIRKGNFQAALEAAKASKQIARDAAMTIVKSKVI